MRNGINVLIVTGDPALRSLIEPLLGASGFHSHSVSAIGEALQVLSWERRWDAVLLDVTRAASVDKAAAGALIQQIGGHKVCAFASVRDSSWSAWAKVLNVGCLMAVSELPDVLERLTTWCRESAAHSRDVNVGLLKDLPTMYLEALDEERFFLASSPMMLDLHKNIRKLASVNHPVLILGESGVGKEIVARLLHKYHAAPDKKFVNVNAAAIPAELLESELFGYEAGAFTGAIKSKPGKFELANQGTILLDEIGEMSPLLQAKLLHVLQDGMITRLGGRLSQKIDVRILAATNVNIENAIAEKRFREDLYYRISTFTLVVPALRERREEIPLLIEQLALRAAASAGQEPTTFSTRLIEAAQEYDWPGNLRELRNFVTRLLVLEDEDSAYKQLRTLTKARAAAGNPAPVIGPPVISTASSASGMKGVVSDMKDQVEGAMIREALVACGWNRRRAASNLNISYRALLYKIQKHRLSA